MSTEGEGAISQSRFCDVVTEQPLLSSSCGHQGQQGRGAALRALTHHSFSPAKGKGVGGSSFSTCVSSCLLPFSLLFPVYSSAFLRATVPNQLLAVIEISLFLYLFLTKPCVTC